MNYRTHYFLDPPYKGYQTTQKVFCQMTPWKCSQDMTGQAWPSPPRLCCNSPLKKDPRWAHVLATHNRSMLQDSKKTERRSVFFPTRNEDGPTTLNPHEVPLVSVLQALLTLNTSHTRKPGRLFEGNANLAKSPAWLMATWEGGHRDVHVQTAQH